MTPLTSKRKEEKSMHKKKLKKMVSLLLAIVTIFSCLALSASAVSLADCFTSGSNMRNEVVDYAFSSEIYYYKTAWGKTEDYGSSHYIRAYLGKDFHGDSGRVWSTYPHKSHRAESDEIFIGTGLAASLASATTYFAYAKYGTSIN